MVSLVRLSLLLVVLLLTVTNIDQALSHAALVSTSCVYRKPYPS